MPSIKETTLEIDLTALAHNYRYLQSKLKNKHTEILGVVKAFAYGNDAIQIARKLQELGAAYLAVSYVDEGIALRKNGIQHPILIFHPQKINFKKLIDYNLIPTLYSPATLDEFIKTAEQATQNAYPVHLNLNTGMNRLGFEVDEIEDIVNRLAQTQAIKIDGIYSHFASSDDIDETTFTQNQIALFEKLSQKIIQRLEYSPKRHLCNTSGILNYPSAHFDMVRAGIGLYGFGNNEAEDKNLHPVGRLKTVISQIHELKEGGTVGYNRSFRAQKVTKIGILPLGYADGLHKSYGNGKTVVRVGGKPAPIIGEVCMGISMIDITGIDCCEGDEVLIFGENKSAETMAYSAGTISYELISGISHRVKRVLI